MGFQNKDVNHIDSDKLNNRLWNLEYCTRRQNHIHYLNNIKNKYNTNISFINKHKKWLVQIKFKGKVLSFGLYNTEKDAIIIRDKYIPLMLKAKKWEDVYIIREDYKEFRKSIPKYIFTDSHKLNISISHTGKYLGENNKNFGVKFTEQRKQKLRDAWIIRKEKQNVSNS